MSAYRWQQAVAGLLLGVVGAIQGCGTGEYENRLQQRIASLSREAAGGGEAAGVQVPGTNVMISVPQGMQAMDAAANPKFVKIPFADLPDWKVTYEGLLEDREGKQHYYCYVAVAAGDNDPATALHAQVSAAMPGTPAPADVALAGPGGKNETWRKFRATGKQSFAHTDKDGNVKEFDNVDGILEVWSRKVPEANSYVLIAWRVLTVNGKEYIGLDQKAQAMAASVTVKK